MESGFFSIPMGLSLNSSSSSSANTPPLTGRPVAANMNEGPKTTPPVQLFPSNKPVALTRYATSTDPRGYIPVFEYTVNEQTVMIDCETAHVLFTTIWKALGHNKADVVKLIDSSPGIASQVRRVRGGNLAIQGTWLPYDLAKSLARRVAYEIRHDLVPLFGPEFANNCLAPGDPGYGQLLLAHSSSKRRRSSADGISRTPSPKAQTFSWPMSLQQQPWQTGAYPQVQGFQSGPSSQQQQQPQQRLQQPQMPPVQRSSSMDLGQSASLRSNASRLSPVSPVDPPLSAYSEPAASAYEPRSTAPAHARHASVPNANALTGSASPVEDTSRYALSQPAPSGPRSDQTLPPIYNLTGPQRSRTSERLPSLSLASARQYASAPYPPPIVGSQGRSSVRPVRPPMPPSVPSLGLMNAPRSRSGSPQTLEREREYREWMEAAQRTSR